MKNTYLLLFLVCIYGCTSTVLSINKTLLDANINLPVDFEKTRASGVWRTAESGHGLEIIFWANRNAEEYKRDLNLEIQGAAELCKALSKYDRILEWDYINIYFFNKYNQMANASHDVVGVVEVIIKRETLLMLHEQNITASKYPQYWRFMSGYKDQPDSKTLLSW
jgi:hypothetical protein